MEEIVVGTKEFLLVDVEDQLGNLTDLSAVGPLYDVKDRHGGFKLQNLVPIVSGLRAQCLVDTAVGGFWEPEHYFLYLRFVLAPESPILGPLEFKVV